MSSYTHFESIDECIFILAISCLAGLLGSVRSKCKVNSTIIFILIAVLNGAFTGYVAYELLSAFIEKRGLTVALSAILAFGGAETLPLLQEKAFEFIRRIKHG